MIESRSIATDGVIYPSPCQLLLVHYQNDSSGTQIIQLLDGQTGPVLMKIHTLKASSNTINIGGPGITVPSQLYADLGGGTKIAIDIIVDRP